MSKESLCGEGSVALLLRDAPPKEKGREGMSAVPLDGARGTYSCM
jgi:hypothetical protein